MFIFTCNPLTVYLFKFRIISRDISQSDKISKKSKLKRDFYKHKSMLSAPFGSTIAPHINVSGLSCYFELVSRRKIRPPTWIASRKYLLTNSPENSGQYSALVRKHLCCPTWIAHSAEKSAQSIANFCNVDAKCGLVNSVENSAQ